MTSDKQRAQVRDYLADRFGEPFNVSVTEVQGFDDEAHVAFPIWTPAGKFTAAHYRYASATAFFKFDGRKLIHPDQLNALYVDLYKQFQKGAHDARNTDQAHADYRAALEAIEED